MKKSKSIQEYNFRSYVDYDYDIERNCDDYRCDGICRCGKIIDKKINSIGSCEKFVLSYYKGLSELNLYCIERILVRCGFYNKYNWEIEVGGGYYGEEVYGVRFNEAHIAGKHIESLMALEDDSQKIEYVLKLEYGYILSSIKNKKWILDYVPRDNLIFGSDHYHRLDLDYVKLYVKRELARGVVLKVDDGYRVTDGYHRLNSGDDELVLVVIGG